MPTVVFQVAGMTCQHCAGAVTDALAGVDGVRHASVDLGAGTATVDVRDDSAVHAARAAVVAAGYETPDGP